MEPTSDRSTVSPDGETLPLDGAAPTCPTPPSADEVSPARRIGNYILESELARGGMGVVFRGRRPELDRTVAIKVLLAGALASPHQRERFRLEAQAAARLRHANIVAIHDVGEDEGRPYLVMDLIEGESLDDRLDRDGPLPPREAAEILKTVALALHHAHEQSILHRDLKPANILVNTEGQPLLTDFGLAKLQDSGETGLTASGQLLGTPGFMPPEQVRSGPNDARADVYGLGATLFALLTGDPPFDSDQIVELIAKIMRDDARPPSALVDGIPSALDVICITCLAKSPDQRYATAAELADDLGRFLRGDSINAKPPGVLQREWEALRQNRKTSWVTNVALIAFALVFGLMIWRTIDGLSYQILLKGLDARTSSTRAESARDLREHPGPNTALLLLETARLDDDPTVRRAALASLEVMLERAEPRTAVNTLLGVAGRADVEDGERETAWRLAERAARRLKGSPPAARDVTQWKIWLAGE